MDVDEEPVFDFPQLPLIDWHYSMRREMQEILPNIFLGPYQCAVKSQLENLQRSGITHILCIRQDIEAKCVRVNFPDHFTYKVIEMRDHPTESIINIFPEARDFIKLALESGGKILIHGLTGMSRSAALVIAYIMESHGLTFEQANKVLKARRNCLMINFGFVRQLKEYEPIYRARHASKSWAVLEGSSSKRRASDDDESEYFHSAKH